jgi:hypothetical protein
MDTRHIIAYGMILGLLLAASAVAWVIRRKARVERREAQRPIRITRKKQAGD